MVWLVLAALGVVGFVVLPRLGYTLAFGEVPDRGGFLLWAAAALFVVSWALPNPDLAHTATFTQHAVGGGAACASAAMWLARNAGVRAVLVRVGLAYALAASLGTAVELGELAYDEWQGTRLGADTSWDLLANSTGAVLAAVVIEAATRLRRPASA